MMWRKDLSQVVSLIDLPYGYSVTIWAAGAIAITHFESLTLLTIFLFLLGAVAAYLTLAITTYRLVETTPLGLTPAVALLNGVAIVAASVTSLVCTLITWAPFGYFVASFVATTTYALSLTTLIRLAGHQQAPTAAGAAEAPAAVPPAPLEAAVTHHVDPQVLKQMLEAQLCLLDCCIEQREATVMFVDIRGYTALSERLAPRQIKPILDDYYALVTRVVQAHGGAVFKFLGDGVLVIFASPAQGDTKDAGAAIAAVRNLLQAVTFLPNGSGEVTLTLGAGLERGLVAVGNIGSNDLMDYTVVGDTVNVASRLAGLAKGGQVLLGSGVVAALPHLPVQALPPVQLKGKREAQTVYALTDGRNLSTLQRHP